MQDVDPYSSQTYDHANLMILGAAAAGQAQGTAIRDHLRKISQGGGDSVDNAVDGLKLLAAGKKIDYTGASGPCDFTDIGDITGTKFRYERVKKGAFEMLRIL
jgi:branched-chain amino acid transport system substrate-binding protein